MCKNTEPGWRSALWIGVTVGTFFVVVMLLTGSTWSTAVRIGKTSVQWDVDIINLAVCARMLREQSDNMHQSQFDACAYFIEDTLIAVGAPELVDD